MAQHYLLDGYNVLHAISELRDLLDRDREAARKLLQQQVEMYCRTGEIAVTIVYDSKTFPDAFDDYNSTEQPVVIFTGFNREADDFIIEAAESHSSANTTVVTNDMKIRNAASYAGCRLMTPEEFIDLVKKKSRGTPGKKPRKYQKNDLSKDEINAWLDLFNQDKNDD